MAKIEINTEEFIGLLSQAFRQLEGKPATEAVTEAKPTSKSPLAQAEEEAIRIDEDKDPIREMKRPFGSWNIAEQSLAHFIEARDRAYPLATRLRAVALVTEGKSFSEAAKVIGCSETAVRIWVEKIILDRFMRKIAA